MPKQTKKEKYERFGIDSMDGVTFTESPPATKKSKQANTDSVKEIEKMIRAKRK